MLKVHIQTRSRHLSCFDYSSSQVILLAVKKSYIYYIQDILMFQLRFNCEPPQPKTQNHLILRDESQISQEEVVLCLVYLVLPCTTHSHYHKCAFTVCVHSMQVNATFAVSAVTTQLMRQSFYTELQTLQLEVLLIRLV